MENNMDAQTFFRLTNRLPKSISKNQARIGALIGKNPYTVSGYGTGRIENIPVAVANLVICLDFLHKKGLIDEVLPHLERKHSEVGEDYVI